MIDRILNKLGIELNDMQQNALQAIGQGDKDVVVLSPTGSGKTLAYLLPLTQLVDAADDEPQAIVVTPGRELALQSATVLKDMGSGLRAMACYGGRATMDEHRVLKQVRPQIVFGTPGRLNDHIAKGNITPYHIKYLVIDEFDKCLEMGFRDESAHQIAARIAPPLLALGYRIGGDSSFRASGQGRQAGLSYRRGAGARACTYI